MPAIAVRASRALTATGGAVSVDGVVRVENGRIPGVDFAQLRAQAQAAGERVWSGWQNWDPHGRTADEMSPYSFPRAN